MITVIPGFGVSALNSSGLWFLFSDFWGVWGIAPSPLSGVRLAPPAFAGKILGSFGEAISAQDNWHALDKIDQKQVSD